MQVFKIKCLSLKMVRSAACFALAGVVLTIGAAIGCVWWNPVVITEELPSDEAAARLHGTGLVDARNDRFLRARVYDGLGVRQTEYYMTSAAHPGGVSIVVTEVGLPFSCLYGTDLSHVGGANTVVWFHRRPNRRYDFISHVPIIPSALGMLANTAVWGLIAYGFWRGSCDLMGRWRRARSALAVRRGVCPRCGYSLRGLALPGCPECGWGRPAGEGEAPVSPQSSRPDEGRA